MKPHELERKKVITKDAKELGIVTSVEIESSSWKVTHLCIGLEDKLLSSLGLTLEKKSGEKYVEALIPTENVAITSDLIVLNKTLEELKTIIKKT